MYGHCDNPDTCNRWPVTWPCTKSLIFGTKIAYTLIRTVSIQTNTYISSAVILVMKCDFRGLKNRLILKFQPQIEITSYPLIPLLIKLYIVIHNTVLYIFTLCYMYVSCELALINNDRKPTFLDIIIYVCVFFLVGRLAKYMYV